jgi:hypothetical protein
MTWTYEYHESSDETTISGQITTWKNGYPDGQAREVVAEMLQSVGTPDRIRMQFDLNYGFDRVAPSDQS